jgi:phospholipid transport system substrate-binding protein
MLRFPDGRKERGMAMVGRRGAVLGLAAGMAGLRLTRSVQAGAVPPAEPPELFVAELAGRVMAALRDPSLDDRQRLVRVDALTAGSFDLDRTARIALGRYWRTAPEAQRDEFAALFKEYVLTSYGRRFHQFADRTFKVTGSALAGDDTVVASLVEGGSTPIRLDWRLATTSGGWRVLDLMVEGVSLLVTFRNEFAAVIERHGGQLGGLLAELRLRVAAERAQLAG